MIQEILFVKQETLDKNFIKHNKELNQKTRRKFINASQRLLERVVYKVEVARRRDAAKISPRELFEHFEKFPNWQDLKSKKWSIDHIFPVQAFIDHKIYDIDVINSIDNLQPMLEDDNYSKNNQYNKEDFKKYLASKWIFIE